MPPVSPAQGMPGSTAVDATTTPGRSVRAVLGAYVALMKPRVIELLLVTTIPAMLLAQRGIPSVWLVLATLLGGTMAAGSANALNCVWDADIDAVMKRTKARPLAKHSVPVRNALVFGLALGVASFGFMWLTTNLLSAVLAVARPRDLLQGRRLIASGVPVDPARLADPAVPLRDAAAG